MTDRVFPLGSSNNGNGDSPTGNVGESGNETSHGSVENLFEHPNPDPGTEYHLTFTDSVKAAIVRAVQKAYDIVQERHDDELGFNAQTFGHNVYHVGKFQLEKCCKHSGGKLRGTRE